MIKNSISLNHNEAQVDMTSKELSRLDHCKDRIESRLEVGKTYRLGIAHSGYLFSHYEICKISDVEVHSPYGTSYSCHYYDGKTHTFAYRWDLPHWSNRTRIVSAEEL